MKKIVFGICSLTVFFGCGGAPNVEPIKASPNVSSIAKPISFGEQDWPLWRGQHQNGLSPDQSAPVKWSETENVIWKSPVPGRGHSSPSIVGDDVFLTDADEKQETQSVICFDRTTGKQKWSTVVNSGGISKKHRKNSDASATPASDGHSVFTAFANHDRLQVVALDFDGNVIWDVDAGEFKSEHGYGSSPTFHENFVIVNGDSRGGGFIAALDRATGEIAWRNRRETTSRHGNYSTPVVATLAGKPQLIQQGYGRTVSYNPETGEEIWRVDGPSAVTANTVAFSDPYVIVSGGYSEKVTMCIQADGTGDVTDSHVKWSNSRNIAYVPSPIIADENVLVLSGEGILTSYNLETGKRNWQERIGGNFSASPVRVGDYFYITNEEGLVTVFQTGEKYEKISENRLESAGGMATPAVSGNQLFIRTDSHLYCLGQAESVEPNGITLNHSN